MLSIVWKIKILTYWPLLFWGEGQWEVVPLSHYNHAVVPLIPAQSLLFYRVVELGKREGDCAVREDFAGIFVIHSDFHVNLALPQKEVVFPYPELGIVSFVFERRELFRYTFVHLVITDIVITVHSVDPLVIQFFYILQIGKPAKYTGVTAVG